MVSQRPPPRHAADALRRTSSARSSPCSASRGGSCRSRSWWRRARACASARPKVAESFSKDVMIVFAGRTSLQAGGPAGRPEASSGRPPTTSRSRSRPLLRLRHARARPEHAGAQRAQQRLAPRHRLDARLRLDPQHRRGRGALPELGRRARRRGGWPSSAATRRSSSSARGRRSGRRSGSGDFPYTVVGLMRHKEQDSSYDGRGHQQGLRALLRGPAGLPEQAALRGRTRWTACSCSRSVARSTHEACKGELRRALGRHPLLRPARRGGGPHLGHGRGSAGLQDDDATG